MHKEFPMRRCAILGVALLAFLLAAPIALGAEKELVGPPAPPKPKPLVISVGSTIRLQMSTKRPIKTVFNERADLLRVTAVPGDPTTVMVTGLAPGYARITLIDIDGKEEERKAGPPEVKRAP
jgi:hypothetical protein